MLFVYCKICKKIWRVKTHAMHIEYIEISRSIYEDYKRSGKKVRLERRTGHCVEYQIISKLPDDIVRALK